MSGVKERLTRLRKPSAPETPPIGISSLTKEPGTPSHLGNANKPRFASGGIKPRVQPAYEQEQISKEQSFADENPQQVAPIVQPSSFKAAPVVAPASKEVPKPTDEIQIAIQLASQFTGLGDQNIPPGSQFTLEQWDKAWNTASTTDQVVVEMHDAQGPRLASIPVLRTHAGQSDDLESKLLGGSMLIEQGVFSKMETSPKEDAKFVFRDWAHKACTPAVYMVIRNPVAIQRMPWLNGVVWNNMEPDASTSEYERQNRMGSDGRNSTQSSRFASTRPRA